MVNVATIVLWGKNVGAVLWDENRQYAIIEFEDSFIKSALDISPLIMPLRDLQNGDKIFSFSNLNWETYYGLPGLLSDSLPDRFGNRILDAWLTRQGRNLQNINPVERLCYTGKRGMGALEYKPAIHPSGNYKSEPLEIKELITLANEILNERSSMGGNLKEDRENSLVNIIKVGTSAGGARAKAVIAYNEQTGEVRSGQADVPENFTHWIIKFDGIKQKELGNTKGYGRIEFAYYKMAVDCGITMSTCKLLEENNRAHFITKRFDRRSGNDKIHLQTLCAIAHFDYNDPNAYSYEQAFQVMRQMRLPYPDAEELYRRMVFNVIARNLDDHTKNISFLMDNNGEWKLSPAYDVTYAYNPESKWTRRHQLSINGKRDGINKEDLLKLGKEMNIKKAKDIIENVKDVISNWHVYAKDCNIPKSQIASIASNHKIDI
jgi:serine/threonine-protein kinase HipA